MVSKVGGTVTGKVFVVPVKAVDGVCLRVEGREVFLYQYDPKYKKRWEDKKAFYKKNGIEEGKNLIVTYDVGGALDSQQVESIIQDVFDVWTLWKEFISLIIAHADYITAK